jgi:nucleoside-diphosphate-sugar epimerase
LKNGALSPAPNDRMAGSSIIVGGGLVGSALARQLRAGGDNVLTIKGVRPTDEISLPAGTRSVFITAQSRDSHSAVATEDLTFVNTGLVEKALAAARSCGVEKVCLFSTASVYRHQQRPLREDDPLDETPGPYAQSKITAERLASHWAPNFRRMLVLRPVMIYGPGLASNRLFARLPEMVREGHEIILAQGRGLVTNPIHAEDAARCAIRLMDGEELGFFNLAGRDIVDLKEIVAIMAAELGLNPRLRETDDPFELLVADIAAMRDAGAVPQINVRYGLREYYRSTLP